jgi:hypothetical protein
MTMSEEWRFEERRKGPKNFETSPQTSGGVYSYAVGVIIPDLHGRSKMALFR